MFDYCQSTCWDDQMNHATSKELLVPCKRETELKGPLCWHATPDRNIGKEFLFPMERASGIGLHVLLRTC